MRMAPLPGALSGKEIVFWRLDVERHSSEWDSGEGARLFGGRWNSVNVRAVYCSIDPALAILEIAVHKGFNDLDVVPHVMTHGRIAKPSLIHIVQPRDVPNSNWLFPGTPSAGQQQFGDRLLTQYPFILIPSTVSRSSWNLIISPGVATTSDYDLVEQERFALDTRLNPSGR